MRAFMLFATLCTLWAAAAPQRVMAQSAQGTVRIELLRPLSFIKTRDMDFAQIIPRPTAQTIVVDGNDICTPTGGLIVTGNCRAAQFAGRGTQNAQVRIRVESSSIQLTGPGASMLLDNFTIYAAPDLVQVGNGNNGNGFTRYRIVPVSGIFDFKVGGRLRVNANQAPGQYSGQFSVRLDYQ